MLFLATIATIIYAIRKARKDLLWRAALQLLGILGQGVLGGITVLTNLNPLAVASHFILSIFLIAGAASMVERGRTPLVSIRPTEFKLRVLVSAQVAITFVVIVLGTLVTGSGPHAGDWQAPRLTIDSRATSWLHADAGIALFGVSLPLAVLSILQPVTNKRINYFFWADPIQG